jgi:ATP-binding cassette, subfamily B (MDR/TAP), member 1
MVAESYEMSPSRRRRSSWQSHASSVTEVDSYSLDEYDSEKRDAQAASTAAAGVGPAAVTAPDAPDAPVDPMELLPEHEREILRAQIDLPQRKYGAGAMYAFATRTDIIIMVVSGICSAASGAALPLMTIIFGGLQKVFNDYIALGNSSLEDFKSDMVEFVLYFVYLAIGTFVTSYVSNVGFIYTGEHIANNIRKAYLQSCLRQNIAYYDAVGTGEIVNRVTADALTIQEGISEKVGMLIQAIATFLTGFVIGFAKFWKLTLILMSTLVALFLNTAIVSKFLVNYSTPMISSITQGAMLGDEVFGSIRVALAFGLQDRMVKRYEEYLQTTFKWGVKSKIAIAIMLAVTMSLTNLTYGLGWWQGTIFMARRELILGDLITTMMAVSIGAFQMGSIGPSFHAFTGSVAAASKLLNTIHRETIIDSSSQEGIKLPKVKGNIRLENLKHIYPSRPDVTVMNGVSLDIPAGKTTALVGASGSGKSTIVGIIERFYQPVGGHVYLDGHDINTLNVKWLRQQIALVGQEPALFAVSIFENIRYGMIGTEYEHASEQEQRERIVDAAKMANAHEFISQLADGYMTNVGDRGFLLSGGQKQRIAIARAIVSNPRSRFPFTLCHSITC